jgi:hypothetical protein
VALGLQSGEPLLTLDGEVLERAGEAFPDLRFVR